MNAAWIGAVSALVLALFAFLMGRKTAPKPKETKVLLGQLQQGKEQEQLEKAKKDLEEKHEKLLAAKEEFEDEQEKHKTMLRVDTEKLSSSEEAVTQFLKQVGKDSRR